MTPCRDPTTDASLEVVLGAQLHHPNIVRTLAWRHISGPVSASCQLPTSFPSASHQLSQASRQRLISCSSASHQLPIRFLSACHQLPATSRQIPTSFHFLHPLSAHFPLMLHAATSGHHIHTPCLTPCAWWGRLSHFAVAFRSRLSLSPLLLTAPCTSPLDRPIPCHPPCAWWGRP